MADKIISGLKFVITSDEFPEQYSVFNMENKEVGYVRVRWGKVSAKYKNVNGKEIYYASVKGGGQFKDETERELHLNNIAKCILELEGITTNDK